jgi:hypothetical protein
LTVSERLHVRDGGLDAQVECAANPIPADCLFASGLTGFQIKAGASFKPWTLGSIRTELLDKSGKLASEVDRLLRAGGRYILICTGHDLTPKERNDSRQHIVGVFAVAGHATAAVDVLGAGQLVPFIERYPGIAASFQPQPIEWALTIPEWSANAHMSNTLEHSDEQQEVISRIRSELAGDAKHIRITGEPGLGKSRLVLEALRDPAIVGTVLYVEKGAVFGQSPLLRHLIKNQPTYPLVLVIDDLQETELTSIWAHLKARCGALRLITLDHGIDVQWDPDILRIQAPRLSDDVIRSILVRHVGESNELSRWIELCGGSPRVAQAVGENLKANPGDLLRPPATVPIWDRFLHGHDSRDDASSRQVDCVARHLALFARFGYESPVTEEARHISALVSKADPSITWARFQEIVNTLRGRRVLQGTRTLFFVPRALHVHLWKQYWQAYGRDVDVVGVITDMPESLHSWFMGMFKYAGDGTTLPVVRSLLRIDGIFANKEVLTSAKGSRFLSTLTEASPVDALRLLESTIGKWSDEELLSLTSNRQSIVWTLEKIAVWREYFVPAAKLLARLAVNENATNSNNSTGTLLGLFTIGLESATTEASPDERLPVLLHLLRSRNEADRMLGLKVANSSLATFDHGFRIVGPEHQGLKQRAELWKPKIYREWWEAYTKCLTTLIEETKEWHGDIRKVLCEALLKAAESQLLVPTSTSAAMHVLTQVAQDPAADRRQLNRLFVNWLDRNEDDEHHKKIVRQVRLLQRRLTHASAKTRFQRYVMDTGWHEWNTTYREKRSKGAGHARQLVAALAHRVARSPAQFDEIESELRRHNDNPEALWYFGEQLAGADQNDEFLARLVTIAAESKQTGCLAGYLSAVWKRTPDAGERLLESFLVDRDRAWLGFRLRAPYSLKRFDLMLDALHNGWVEVFEFQFLGYGGAWKEIQASQLRRLFELLASRSDTSSRRLALDLLESIPLGDDAPVTAQSILELVCSTLSQETEWRDAMFGYHWKAICKKLVAWEASCVLPLFDAILLEMKEKYALSYDDYVASVASELVALDPPGTWNILKRHFEEAEPKWRSDLYGWLKGRQVGFDDRRVNAPITRLPVEAIFGWIKESNTANRAALIAHAAPKGLDDADGGALTRRLLVEFADIEGVKNGISATFGSGGWSGPTSVYLRGKREKLRTWLAAGFEPVVVAWIEEEMTHFDRRIEDAEIEEEREHWD